MGAPDAPWGVKISDDASDVLGQAADVVIHSTSSALPKVMEQLLACLEAESCVVSTCEELSYPFRTYPELAAKLDEAAKVWGVALVGTGVNPGFVLDKLIVTLAAVSQRIEHVSGQRIVDAGKRRVPLQKKIGAGMTLEEFREKVSRRNDQARRAARIGGPGGGQPESAGRRNYRNHRAGGRQRTRANRIPDRGSRAGRGRAPNRARLSNGKELIYLELQMYVGAQDPARHPGVTRHPNISLVIPGGSPGDIATASVVVNSIPVILDAPAGLRTARDLPIGFFSPDARP